jgi:hypothetical protein
MTDTKQYPTAILADSGWVETTNALGTEDGNCATKSTTSYVTFYFIAGTFDWTSIPSNAVITGVFWDTKIRKNCVTANSYIKATLLYSVTTLDYYYGGQSGGLPCSGTVYGGERDVTAAYLAQAGSSPSKLSNLKLHFELHNDTAGVLCRGAVDAGFIRVEYTVPQGGILAQVI